MRKLFKNKLLEPIWEPTQLYSESFKKKTLIIMVKAANILNTIAAEKYFENSTGFLFVHLSANC